MKSLFSTITFVLVLGLCTTAYAAEDAMQPSMAAPAMTVEAPMTAPSFVMEITPAMTPAPAMVEVMAAPVMEAPMAATMAAIAPMEATMAVAAMVEPMVAEPVMEAPPAAMTDPVTMEFDNREPVASEQPPATTSPDAVVVETKPAVTIEATKIAPVTTPSKDNKAVLWIGIIGLIMMALLGILGTMGYLNWTQKERVLKGLKIADKILDGLVGLAKTTPVKWDDAIVDLLKNVNTRFIAAGEKALNNTETVAIKTVAETRKNQIVPPEANIEEPKKDVK